MKLVLIAIVLSLFAAMPALADPACPEALSRQLANQAPLCRLLQEDTLVSSSGNADVVFRLYRWVSEREPAPSPLYDAAPYNQVGLTLGLRSKPEDEPFWTGYFWLGEGWFETPRLVADGASNEKLVIPGRYSGTGALVSDRLFLPTAGRTWVEIDARQRDPESGEGWLNGLLPYLPPGSYIAKGIHIDYATLRGESPVWRESDANCCPTGGRISFRLELSGSDLALRVAEAAYRP